MTRPASLCPGNLSLFRLTRIQAGICTLYIRQKKTFVLFLGLLNPEPSLRIDSFEIRNNNIGVIMKGYKNRVITQIIIVGMVPLPV